jgi:hypothetical protein
MTPLKQGGGPWGRRVYTTLMTPDPASRLARIYPPPLLYGSTASSAHEDCGAGADEIADLGGSGQTSRLTASSFAQDPELARVSRRPSTCGLGRCPGALPGLRRVVGPPDGLAAAMSCQQHTQYGLSKDPGPLSPCARRAWYCICPCRTSFHRTRTRRCTSYQQISVNACGRKSSEPGLVGIGEEEGLRGCRWRTVPHCTVVNRDRASRPRPRSCQG